MGSARFNSLETENFRVTEAWFPGGAVLAPHTHERAIFGVMMRGGFRTRIAHRELSCMDGTAFTEPLAEKHSNYIGPQGATSLVVEPDPTRIELLRPFAILLDRVHEVRCPDALTEAPKILAEIRQPDRFNSICAESHILILLTAAARTEVRDGNGNRPPAWLVRARDILHDEWRRTVSLSRIAEAVGVHPCHLTRIFRRYYGESVGSYLRKLRINWAISQLALVERSISHIAIDAGFSDQSHFTRECKRHLGVTPAAYRARLG